MRARDGIRSAGLSDSDAHGSVSEEVRGWALAETVGGNPGRREPGAREPGAARASGRTPGRARFVERVGDLAERIGQG
jgi:hypothetical protein